MKNIDTQETNYHNFKISKTRNDSTYK